MKYKELIEKFAEHVIEEGGLLYLPGKISKILNIPEKDAEEFITLIGAEERVGERYVFEDEEPEKFNYLASTPWFKKDEECCCLRPVPPPIEIIDGKRAIKYREKIIEEKTEESRYFNKLLREGGLENFVAIFEIRPHYNKKNVMVKCLFILPTEEGWKEIRELSKELGLE